ncbi:hypothetical protein [Aquisalimonas sp.]|uniref:hypothetical protein n=1 Tax=Aquisalimonas sp. TaxID=1872621 RepID=UPI0025BC393C|nr:hypothetical protein [Aquisalimonas sp.]
MPYQVIAQLNGRNPVLQIRDTSSNQMRLVWEYRKPSELGESVSGELLADLEREEALHDLFRRLFLLTTEQYLRGELSEEDLRSRRHRSIKGSTDS